MNLLQVKALSHLREDLTDILDYCYTQDQIVLHFSQYLLGELSRANIEDYDFFPNVTTSGIDVTVHVFFPWDSTARHEFTVVKKDSPKAAYNRAMGIV
jgi:hypothetical protein